MLIADLPLLLYAWAPGSFFFFFEIRHIACISLSRREWSIDLHIVTKGFTGKPWITNKVLNINEKQEHEGGGPFT
jgi:hypothetical protein